MIECSLLARDGVASSNNPPAMSPRLCRIAAVLALFTLTAHALPAKKLDLDRVTPVPDDQPIPVMDFFRPRILLRPSLSPDGTHVAAIVSAGVDRHDLLVYDRATQKFDRLSGRADTDIYSSTWLDSHRLLFHTATRKLYGVGLMAAEVGRLSGAYPILQYYGSRIVAVRDADRLRPLVWNSYDSLEGGAHPDLGVAMVNTSIKTGKVIDLLGVGLTTEMIDEARDNNERHILKRYPLPPNDGVVVSYMADQTGELAFCQTMREGHGTLYRLEGDAWLKCPVDVDDIEIIDSGEKPGQLVVIGPRQEGKPRALEFMDAASGRPGEVLLQDDAYDFYSSGISTGWLRRHPVTHQILGAVYDRDGPAEVWFGDSYRQLKKIIEGMFPGLAVRIIDSDDAQRTFLVASSSDRQPVIYSWVDLEKHAAGLFKNSAPWIDPKRMQPMNIVKFKTRDGHKLDAYLTLPKGTSKQNPAPLVVLPHGGPWARDSWGFDGEAQFLASRGYAVLQPNYRGSNGCNWAFPEADKYDFAKMHDDVTDATKAIIATGLIDPRRIGIMGGSFGGYLAISGVVNDPDLYRCAVTIAGVFDWERMIRDKKYDQYDSPAFGYFMRYLGDPSEHPERFEAISPGRHVDRIRVPVFVSGGKEDSTVDISQSRALVSDLERYHVPHETYIVGAEGHGMQHLDKQVELYTRIEAFLDRYLKHAAAQTAATAAH